MKQRSTNPLHSIPLLLLAAAVQQANATAIANPDTATMIQGTGSIAIDVLANDTSDNIENNTLFIDSFDSTSTGYGSVILDSETNQLVYTPPSEDFVGTDTFTYFVVDDSGYGGSTVVTVEVTEPEPERDRSRPFQANPTAMATAIRSCASTDCQVGNTPSIDSRGTSASGAMLIRPASWSAATPLPASTTVRTAMSQEL